MHSAGSQERASSSVCCQTVATGKSKILEHNNNNNNDVPSPAFRPSPQQHATHVSPKMNSMDTAKSDPSSLPPSSARSLIKNSTARIGNGTKEKDVIKQDRSGVSLSHDTRSSGSSVNIEPGRRVSSGVEMMSRFAPRPYRPASADSKVIRTRSQSVEAHSLSRTTSGPSAGHGSQSSLRGKIGSVADDSRVRQLLQNSTPSAAANETSKTVVTVSSSACGVTSDKLSSAKGSSLHAVSHSDASTVMRQNKDLPRVSSLMQNANSLPHGSKVRDENPVKSNSTVPTKNQNVYSRERTTATVPLLSVPQSSDAVSSAAAGGCSSSAALHSHSLPPQHTYAQTVTATASVSSKMASYKKSSLSADFSETVDAIPSSTATSLLKDATKTTVVHLSPAISCRQSSSGQAAKSNECHLKDHARDASPVPSEGPLKPDTSAKDSSGGPSTTLSSSGTIKHRAVIKSGPESLLFSNSCLGPVPSQKPPKDGVSSSGDSSVGLCRTLSDGATVKTSVALAENAKVSAAHFSSSLSSSVSYSATSASLDNSPLSDKLKRNNGTSSSFVSSSPFQTSPTASSKSSLSSHSAAILNAETNSALTSQSPSSCVYQRSSPDSPVSPSDSLIVMDSPLSLSLDSQRQLDTSTGLRLSTKIDTSNDSVSSALSVLMKRQSASGTMVPASPKCSYRYGSRGAISSIYQNKLGSGASSQYNKNMTDLYGDFFRNMKDCRSVAKDSNAAVSETTSQPDRTSALKTPSTELMTGKTLAIKPGVKDDSSLPVSYNDQTSLNLYLGPTERRSRCNAPQPIRRVLSCDSASSRVKISSPMLTSESRRIFFEGSSDATVKLDGAQVNGVDCSVSPTSAPFDPPFAAQASFIDDPGTNCGSEADVSCFATVRETQRKSKLKPRVSFEPVSLLLNAALEGELDLVKVTIPKVRGAMVSNESGVTALHNSVFSGRPDVCRFLIDYGCPVNVTDADGWTPLHCAASCNNIEMVKLLVQSGACLFAMTSSDRQIPVEKCNRQLSAYDDCCKYLSEQSQAIGVANSGIVYATADYNAAGSDELSFREADQLRVIRKGDEAEMEWWWAKPVNQSGKQGYVPRNYLSMYPAKPKLTEKN